MKGFIEVTRYIDNNTHSQIEFIPIKNIRRATSDGHYGLIVTFDNDFITTEETYKEIKELIKQAQ